MELLNGRPADEAGRLEKESAFTICWILLGFLIRE